MDDLTGIQIIVRDKPKFVGKAGVCPRNPVKPELQGQFVFYREVKLADLYSYKTESLSVDRAVWDEASRLGAMGMLCCCKADGRAYWVTAKTLEDCRVVDLGEYPQIRVPIKRVETIHTADGVNFGWTSNVITARTEKSATSHAAPNPQPTLF